jgi:pseudouridine synthase
MAEMRVNKFLAMAGVASRRGADKLIEEGGVTINGHKADIGSKVNTEEDHVKVGNRLIRYGNDEKYYLLVNKPVGYLCSASDPDGRQLVGDLVKNFTKARLFTVGRLDFNSEGLILMTNDGDWAAKVGHPSTGPMKTYQVRVRGVPDEKKIEILRRGVKLKEFSTSPAIIKRKKTAKNSWLEVSIREGKNREIRQMFEHIRHPVVKLRRVRIGAITADGIKPGAWRLLSDSEVAKLIPKKKK